MYGQKGVLGLCNSLRYSGFSDYEAGAGAGGGEGGQTNTIGVLASSRLFACLPVRLRLRERSHMCMFVFFMRGCSEPVVPRLRRG